MLRQCDPHITLNTHRSLQGNFTKDIESIKFLFNTSKILWIITCIHNDHLIRKNSLFIKTSQETFHRCRAISSWNNNADTNHAVRPNGYRVFLTPEDTNAYHVSRATDGLEIVM